MQCVLEMQCVSEMQCSALHCPEDALVTQRCSV
jgi:hypothetical protein